MSQYRTTYRDASEHDCYEAALCMYSQQEYPSRYWTFAEYEEVLTNDVYGVASVIVYSGMSQVAWLTYEISTDMHYPGVGITVFHMLVNKYHPHALRHLMRAVQCLGKLYGAEWIRTFKRLDDTTYIGKFRRLT